jgi:hypothetical protein
VEAPPEITSYNLGQTTLFGLSPGDFFLIGLPPMTDPPQLVPSDSNPHPDSWQLLKKQKRKHPDSWRKLLLSLFRTRIDRSQQPPAGARPQSSREATNSPALPLPAPLPVALSHDTIGCTGAAQDELDRDDDASHWWRCWSAVVHHYMRIAYCSIVPIPRKLLLE